MHRVITENIVVLAILELANGPKSSLTFQGTRSESTGKEQLEQTLASARSINIAASLTLKRP